jgi:hypothetical protein
MAIKYETKEFSRVGRKTEGEEDVKYAAQILTDDSVSSESVADFMQDVVTVIGGDTPEHLKLAADYFRTGANQHIRLAAGGYTPEEKAAKALLKAMPAQFKGKSVADVVALLKSLS